MEPSYNSAQWLHLIDRPAFCVRDGKILHVNQAARQLFIEPDTDVAPLLVTGAREYAQYAGGTLYLAIQAAGAVHDAMVAQVEGLDVFYLDQSAADAGLRALALSSLALREPLTDILNASHALFSDTAILDAAENREYALQINRSLSQLMRLVVNMSDAERYAQNSPRLETRNIVSLIGEILEKAQRLVSQAGFTLRFRNLEHAVYTLVDEERLERAIYNMLSNAIKFSSPGSTITAELTKTDYLVSFTLQDSGAGVPEDLRGSLFSRFLRQSSLADDSRSGIGLGLALVRSAAAAHGGTVLLDHPEGQGLRIRLTVSRRLNPDAALHNKLRLPDYTGGMDHGLVELSEVLPASLYQNI